MSTLSAAQLVQGASLPVAPAVDPSELSALEALSALRSRELTAVELLAACTRRIEAYEPVVKAFITRTQDVAERAAASSDTRYRTGRPLPLDGLPIGLKDLFYTKGILTTAASKALATFVPDHDATAWTTLRDAGGVLMGKLNLHEFAVSAQTTPTTNPWNTALGPAGSSGGSAAALAARYLPIATGTDTGGSIRAPASACGVVGMKPTLGRVSRHGVITCVWSLDHAGVLTRTVADSAYLLHLIQGPDPHDPTTLSRAVTIGTDDYPVTPPKDLHGRRVGIPTSFFWSGLDAGVEKAALQAVAELRRLGAVVVDVDLPPSFGPAVTGDSRDPAAGPLNAAAGIFVTIGGSELAAYHRYLIEQKGPQAYSPATLAFIESGVTIRARDYLRAQQLRTVLRREMAGLFSAHRLDAIAHPTLPVAPPRQVPFDSPSQAANLSLTQPWDLCGFPSLTLPVGLDAGGVPVGLLLSGPPLAEATLFSIALALERSLAFATTHRPGLLSS
ncbi:MAG: aspartyl-tRNA(Asn)/glutamyl-tRNA(Gln) amidotransferase subunit [Frankiales bacterium]|nr:aspartyl-tRNA(Asn)/glutamyl-tRNA(Gln) amidotransferase subunit [Frankiales bacterium]